jgi:hypothetical protein
MVPAGYLARSANLRTEMYRIPNKTEAGVAPARNGAERTPSSASAWRSGPAALLLLLFFFSILQAIASAQFSDSFAQSSSHSGARPILIARPAKLENDSVKFINGDSLTGTIESIADGSLSIHLDLLGDAAEFPVRNVSEIAFSGPSNPAPERADVIYLRDGSSLTATVIGLSPDALRARTLPGQQLTLPKDGILGIGLYRSDNVLFENDFAMGKDMGLVPVLGTWNVEKGQLVQTASRAFCRAYVPLVQAGMMRYEWTIDGSHAHNAGLLFFAARYDSRFGHTAYMVMLKDRMVYLYKVIAERRNQAWRERVKSAGSLIHLAVEYDPRTGEIVVRSGEDVVVRLVDPDPLRRGEYVLLHTEGKAAFESVRVTHLVGAIRGLPLDAAADTLLLSNGDRVSGEVVGISDEVILRNPYAVSDTPVDKAAVSSIVFANTAGDAVAEEPKLPRITLWNGDKIFARVLDLHEDQVILEPRFTERLVLARSCLREVIFPESSSAATSEDASADGPAEASEDGQIDFTDFVVPDQEGE